jgi:type I restriction enzyme, S subunit
MSTGVAVEMYGGRWKQYPAYKDSGVEWLGEVPEHWVVKQFKRVTTRIDVGIAEAATHAYADDGVPIIRSTNVRPGRILIDNLFYIQEWFAEKNRTKYLFENDLITVRTGAPGTTAVIPPELHGCQCFTMLITTLKPKKVPMFYSYFLNSSCARFRFAVEGWGTAQINISVPILQQQMIAEPPEKEQRAIAAFLDRETGRIDTFIEKKERQIELLQEKRAVLISHAVTKGLDPDVTMKDSGVEWLGEVPEHWEIMKFRRVCRLQQGLQIAQSDRFGENGSNRFEYITIKSIHASDTTNSKEYIENPTRSVICTTDDILLARTGATGEVITGQNGVFHNNFFKIIYDRKIVDKNYLIYYLSNTQIKKHFLLMAGTTTIPDLNHGDFLSTHFISPDIHEQQNIISFLNNETGNIDTLLDKIWQSISKLREYRIALISATVTGKIDVRQEAA